MPAVAVIVTLLGGAIGRVHRHGLGVVLSIGVWGLAITLFGLTSTLWLGLVMLAFAGAADTVSAVYRSTILQVATPAGMQGRLQAVFIVVVVGGPRLGDLESGAVATAFTPRVSVVSGGLACLAGIGLLALAGRPLAQRRCFVWSDYQILTRWSAGRKSLSPCLTPKAW
ncbi:MAG: MFS transporter [Actinomycetota bacterium]|nr:MFS transporter [Actinomycetota bacterium]